MDRFSNTSLAEETKTPLKNNKRWGLSCGSFRSGEKLLLSNQGPNRKKMGEKQSSYSLRLQDVHAHLLSCKIHQVQWNYIRFYVCTTKHILNVCWPEGGTITSTGSVRKQWYLWEMATVKCTTNCRNSSVYILRSTTVFTQILPS